MQLSCCFVPDICGPYSIPDIGLALHCDSDFGPYSFPDIGRALLFGSNFGPYSSPDICRALLFGPDIDLSLLFSFCFVRSDIGGPYSIPDMGPALLCVPSGYCGLAD